jgi:hypothetical protein
MGHVSGAQDIIHENGIIDLPFIPVYYERCHAMRHIYFLESVGTIFSLTCFYRLIHLIIISFQLLGILKNKQYKI